MVIFKKHILLIFLAINIISLSHSYSKQKSQLLFIIKLKNIEHELKQDSLFKSTGSLSESKLVAIGLIKFYQKFISSQDIPACNFIPSCSEFACQSIQKCGLLKGILLTSDRLQRCNGLSTQYYKIDQKSGKFIDPVENYCKFTKKDVF